jgi:hypothetical protein
LFLYNQISSFLFVVNKGCCEWREVDDAAIRKRKTRGSCCSIMADDDDQELPMKGYD